MEIIDKGHLYKLKSLDGDYDQTIRFVKRTYLRKPKSNTYAGTTCQDVLRVLYDRVQYLHDEIPHWVNPIIMFFLKASVWLFELRAARRRKHYYFHTLEYSITSPMCHKCGHTDCRYNH